MHCVKSVRISPYSVRMQENPDQNNSKHGHFLRSDNIDAKSRIKQKFKVVIKKSRKIPPEATLFTKCAKQACAIFTIGVIQKVCHSGR